MRMPILTGAVLALGSVACGGDGGGPSRSNVVLNDNASSTVDTLMLLVSVRLVGPTDAAFVAYDGYYVDFTQVTQARLGVDGGMWGLFDATEQTATEPPDADVNGWWLNVDSTQALVVAELGSEAAGEPVPATVGGWITVLSRRLPAGGHVADVQELVLTNAGGTSVTFEPRAFVSFDTRAGDTTAVIGTVNLEVAGFGGGP